MEIRTRTPIKQQVKVDFIAYKIYFCNYFNSVCIFSDIVYIWDLEKNSWVDKSQLVTTDPAKESAKPDVDSSIENQVKPDSSTTESKIDANVPSVNKVETPNLTLKSSKKTDESKKCDDEEEEDSDEEPEKPEPMKQDMSKGVYGYEDDTYTYTDATDGTKYFWDKEKSAWFPKVISSWMYFLVLFHI